MNLAQVQAVKAIVIGKTKVILQGSSKTRLIQLSTFSTYACKKLKQRFNNFRYHLKMTTNLLLTSSLEHWLISPAF